MPDPTPSVIAAVHVRGDQRLVAMVPDDARSPEWTDASPRMLQAQPTGCGLLRIVVLLPGFVGSCKISLIIA